MNMIWILALTSISSHRLIVVWLFNCGSPYSHAQSGTYSPQVLHQGSPFTFPLQLCCDLWSSRHFSKICKIESRGMGNGSIGSQNLLPWGLLHLGKHNDTIYINFLSSSKDKAWNLVSLSAGGLGTIHVLKNVANANEIMHLDQFKF